MAATMAHFTKRKSSRMTSTDSPRQDIVSPSSPGLYAFSEEAISVKKLSPEEILSHVSEFDVTGLTNGHTQDAEEFERVDWSSPRDETLSKKRSRSKSPPRLDPTYMDFAEARFDFTDDVIENTRIGKSKYDLTHKIPYTTVRRGAGATESVSLSKQNFDEFKRAGIEPRDLDVIFDAEDFIDPSNVGPVITLDADAVAEQFHDLAIEKEESSTAPKSANNGEAQVVVLKRSESEPIGGYRARKIVFI